MIWVRPTSSTCRTASGRIQIYVKIDEMGEEAFAVSSGKWDLGDIIGVEGEVFRTRRGEISVKAKKHDPALQVPAAAAREVPRPARTPRPATASAMWT